jgi:hypothetical protein
LKSQLIELRAERSLEKLDHTLKQCEEQMHFQEIMGMRNLSEQSGKIKELVLRHKARVVQRNMTEFQFNE